MNIIDLFFGLVIIALGVGVVFFSMSMFGWPFWLAVVVGLPSGWLLFIVLILCLDLIVNIIEGILPKKPFRLSMWVVASMQWLPVSEGGLESLPDEDYPTIARFDNYPQERWCVVVEIYDGQGSDRDVSGSIQFHVLSVPEDDLEIVLTQAEQLESLDNEKVASIVADIKNRRLQSELFAVGSKFALYEGGNVVARGEIT